jgi:ADP-ribose pyrophosphatase YjhB (NUDIX family)
MEIKITRTTRAGQIEHVTYRDILSEADLAGKKISGVRAYCFYQGKLVMAYDSSKKYWIAPGGGVEENEDLVEALKREVKEEANMKVLKYEFLNFTEVVRPHKTDFYVSAVCLVEPYGEFVSDPDGDITEIKLIDFKDYKSYLNNSLSQINDRQIARAHELKEKMEKEVGLV